MPTADSSANPALARVAFNEAMLALLADINRGGYGACPLEEALDRLLSGLLRVTGSSVGFIGHVAVDGTHRRLRLRAGRSVSTSESEPSDVEVQNFQALFGGALAAGALIANDASWQLERHALQLAGSPVRQLLSVPMRRGNELVGLVE